MAEQKTKSLKGTWSQALLTFFGPILAVMIIRWAIVEPFVVPSGSMIPTLKIHDHIIANKMAYGLHIPFSQKWLIRWSRPERGDIAVFRFPKTPDVFYVKRIVGVPGDEIELKGGILFINGKAAQQNDIRGEESGFDYFKEDFSTVGTENAHVIRYLDKESAHYEPRKILEGQYFAMGDNRDQSSDSRVWGVIPEENLIGSVRWVWLSCEYTLASAQFLCDPQTIRWERIFKRLE
jgi:signal peptidase I